MEDPNADTQWNDILRQKGILPPKEEKEITEDDVISMVEKTIEEKSHGKAFDDMTLDELNEKEDDIDEKVQEKEFLPEKHTNLKRFFPSQILEIGLMRQRMAEMREASMKAKYGCVKEISKVDYVTEVNQAGEGVWVVLHVYKNDIPLCKLINQHIMNLAGKFPEVKFLRSVSSVCIPNYPDKNLPTIFVYYEGDMKKQFIGPHEFGGMNFTQDELEWNLSKIGAVKTELEEPPKKSISDVMDRAMKESAIDDCDDDNDW
ncbi:Phosducin-like protein 2,Viral IAP-associated factor homolog,Phosducin-like protein 3 [Mytilus coruscus]|uniref:Phosducin-like protein 2,Viral IAP-associated factor homolog,Phosducin-like protein 3 n=1 Tax=Mytilus coruscus TaxID=42192 RepID=A0A6J8AYA6_MYTCO|nr:Phosducin-like protein 2,Viral IAP-associated factor homolog,Phosducin-like protein 3 [Mytilus coruscus]